MPYWEVDLGEEIHVHYVVIYQRLNFNSLKKFDVIAYDSQNKEVWLWYRFTLSKFQC